MRGWILLLSFEMLVTGGCGGRVRFAPDAPPKEIPSPLPPAHVLSESYLYGKASGTQVIVFSLYPRKSMRQARERAILFLPAFMDSVWNGAEGYQGMSFVVLRDVVDANMSWYSPREQGIPRANWKGESLRFLQDQLGKLPIEKGSLEAESISPFDHLQRVASRAASRISAQEGPVWLNYYYFRDGDPRVGPNDAETLNQSAGSLQGSLRMGALSPFRTMIHLTSYFDEQSECAPLPNRLSRILARYLAPFQHHTEELCGLLAKNPRLPLAAMERLGAQAHSLDRRIILKKPPRQESLRVSINGQTLPREQFSYLDSSNEILFLSTATPSPVEGDEIRVEYEPATD